MRRMIGYIAIAALIYLVSASQAHADPLTFQVNPLPNALPGDTITLSGVIANTTANRVYLHGDTSFLQDPNVDITLDSSPFFLFAPTFLEPTGDPSGTDMYAGDFLDIVIGADVTPGVYTGFFPLNGGATPTLTDPLGSASFSVTVTPEPGSTALMAALGVWGAGFLNSRASKNRGKRR